MLFSSGISVIIKLYQSFFYSQVMIDLRIMKKWVAKKKTGKKKKKRDFKNEPIAFTIMIGNLGEWRWARFGLDVPMPNIGPIKMNWGSGPLACLLNIIWSFSKRKIDTLSTSYWGYPLNLFFFLFLFQKINNILIKCGYYIYYKIKYTIL
jgi:hypothetical protein